MAGGAEKPKDASAPNAGSQDETQSDQSQTSSSSQGTSTQTSDASSSGSSTSTSSGGSGRRRGGSGKTVDASGGNIKTKGGGAGMMSGSSTKSAETQTEDAPEAPVETSESTSGVASSQDLETLAPIPNEPSVYGPGMIVYKATILFTVELRDDSAKTENAQPQAQPQESTQP